MRRIVSVSIVLTLALFGCTKTETGSTATTSTQSTATTATVAAVPQPVSTTTATTATVPPTAGVIATAEGEKPGVRIDLTELKRTSGGTVNLKFAIVNSGTERMQRDADYFGDHNVSADHYWDISGVHLIDPINKKKYFVVTDAEKKCLCSKEIPGVDAGSRLNLWAKFSAPPPDVTKVTVEIPHFQPMDDVPISQ